VTEAEAFHLFNRTGRYAYVGEGSV